MKQIKYIIFLLVLCLFFLIPTEGSAQTSRESEVKERTENKVFSNKKVASKKTFNRTEEQGMKEYEALMKENKKKYKKIAKGMEEPQYSDPMYFGHKKRPKKRKPGNRKFCKECGIVH